MTNFLQAKNKPDDWPINEKEVLLENIYVSLNDFVENPGYRTKEVVVSLVSAYDLNKRSYVGKYRVSKFEAQLINIIFMQATQCNLNAVRTCMYTIISDTVRMQKSMSWVSELLKENSDIRIIPYEEWLVIPLKLYYFAYQRFDEFCYRFNRRNSHKPVLTHLLECCVWTDYHKASELCT